MIAQISYNRLFHGVVVPSQTRARIAAALFPPLCSSTRDSHQPTPFSGKNQQRRKHKEEKKISRRLSSPRARARARSHSPALASRKTRQFVLRQINFLKYAGLPVVAGSFIARMFYGHVFFFLALHRTSTSCARAYLPRVPLHLPFVPDTPWRVIKSGPDICENILPSEQENVRPPGRDTLEEILAANSKNVIHQLTKTNISKRYAALGLIGEPSLITPRAAAGFDHDHPASSGNEIACRNSPGDASGIMP